MCEKYYPNNPNDFFRNHSQVDYDLSQFGRISFPFGTSKSIRAISHILKTLAPEQSLAELKFPNQVCHIQEFMDRLIRLRIQDPRMHLVVPIEALQSPLGIRVWLTSFLQSTNTAASLLIQTDAERGEQIYREMFYKANNNLFAVLPCPEGKTSQIIGPSNVLQLVENFTYTPSSTIPISSRIGTTVGIIPNEARQFGGRSGIRISILS